MCNLLLVCPNKRTLGRYRVQCVSAGWLLLRLRLFDKAVCNLLLVRPNKRTLGRNRVWNVSVVWLLVRLCASDKAMCNLLLVRPKTRLGRKRVHWVSVDWL